MNAVNWFAIPVADLERARTFYCTIFAYDEMPDMETPMGTCAIFPHGENGVGGSLNPFMGIKSSEDSGVTVWLDASPDLQQVLDRVEAAGGRVLQEKTPINEEYGFMGMIVDSEGNRVGVHSMG